MSGGSGAATGTLGEEVLRLLADLSAARGHAHDVRGADEPDEPGTEQAARRPSCDWCPLCRLLDLARETSPDALAHLGDALDSLAALVRTLGEQTAHRDGSHETDPADQTPRPSGRTVETIDLTEDDSWH